ncbi:MAG: DUF1566 domain-containing protein [Treponema sp.]|nr:DUF1566 domain-containing protein [Treponema sp.]
MKKTFLLISLAAAMLVPLYAQGLPRLAVAEFTTNSSTDKAGADAITVRDLAENRIVQVQQYRVIPRNEIDRILANNQIQATEISSTENIQKLQQQNIDYIITGSVIAVGDDYAVTVRLLDVSTGRFSRSESGLMGSGSQDLFNGIDALMTNFIAETAVEESRVTQAESNRIYTVGGIGPAGGIVFYDKGVFSDGWRYLEAAPAETEFTAQWGSMNQIVAGTTAAAGTGRRNTELITERLRQLGETGRAAQICKNLNFHGYSDWFLPSIDELNLMYRNLKQRGLGGFIDEQYWSSSEIGSDGARVQDFSDGRRSNYQKANILRVRAIRAF